MKYKLVDLEESEFETDDFACLRYWYNIDWTQTG